MQILQLIPWWGWLIAAGFVVILIAILAKLFKAFAELLKLGLTVITTILKIVWAVITAPFRLIAWAIRRVRARKFNLNENNYAKEE